ncbi:hypothetical protein EDB89DRAFT_435420 [Lactarius sanguifluus]|nr:hypothetical protein EDB89DRAFT_435420 [Lactarius sanguifluus]
MNAMDAQRYDPSKRLSPAYEENDTSDTGSAHSDIPSAVQKASSIERPQSPFLTTARSALKFIPHFNSSPCTASNVPLPLSPVFSPSTQPYNRPMEDGFTLPDALDKDSLISSEHDPKPLQGPENAIPSFVAPLPRVPNTFMLSMQPLVQQNDTPARVFSRPSSPSPISPALSPLSGPGDHHFWQMTSPNTEERQARSPASGPLYDHFDGCSTSNHLYPTSCPTSPLLRSSNAIPCPTGPPTCHAMFSNVSRRLRALNSTSPVPSRSTSPISRPTSPILQAFSVDNWVPERDPTEGIDIIEIFVTKEISIHVEEII